MLVVGVILLTSFNVKRWVVYCSDCRDAQELSANPQSFLIPTSEEPALISVRHKSIDTHDFVPQSSLSGEKFVSWLNIHDQVLLVRKPIACYRPRLLFISNFKLEITNKLSQKLVHLDLSNKDIVSVRKQQSAKSQTVKVRKV